MRFELKAMKSGGSVVAMALDAADASDAIGQAQARGYKVIIVRATQSVFRSSLNRTSLLQFKSKFPLVQFSQELLALLQAGLSLVESLETLTEKEQRPEVKKVLTRINTCLYEGRSLSHALQHSSDQFPPMYVATVRASEKTGGLPEALSRFIVYQLQVDAVKRQIVSASIYPILLASFGGLVTLFLMIYVVPRFSHVYADLGRNLPFMSRLLMHWGEFLGAHGIFILVSTLAALALSGYALTRQGFRQWIEIKLWQVPGIGARLHVYQLARFYRSLGMLLTAGMPVLPSLTMVSDLLQSSLRSRLAEASGTIREGQCISEAMEREGLTTAVSLRMLRVGERTGRMGEMMERIASFYEEDTARWVERFTKLFEPLLMVAIGLLIGIIVVLMYLPIFELAGSIQ